MPRLALGGALTALALLPCASSALAADHVPGEVVVRFAPDRAPGAVAAALDAVDAVDATPLAPLPATRVVEVGDGTTVAEAVEALERLDDVLWAEPNYVFETTATPNDPLFTGGGLWGLRNTGQLDAAGGQTGVAGIDIGAPAAWDVTTGSPSVLVGVADTGIAHHADLDAHVRDDLSRDFAHPGGSGNDDPRLDPNRHGTHVAGTIGAIGDNARGVTGVGWSTGLVALRVLFGGTGTSAGIAAGFAYAGQRGLPVVNASLGGSGDSKAVNDAIALSPGTLFVVAAGNEANDNDATPQYPCNAPGANVICVAAIDNRGDMAWFSNYGATSVDLAAPGVRILSTLPTYSTAATATIGAWNAYGHGTSWSLTGGKLTTGYGPSAEAYADVPPIDLSGRTACSVNVTWSLDADGDNGADARAGMAIEQYDPSTGAWRWLGGRYGPTATRTDAYALVSEDGAGQRLRVRLFTESTAVAAPGRGATVDALRVDCQTAGESYGVLNGTSMATPHVAGAAALLKARRPDLTTAQLRAALLSSARPLPSLTGKVVTGGTLDVAAALAAVAPTPSGGGGGGGGSATSETPAPPVSPPAPDPVPVPLPGPSALPVAPIAPAPEPVLGVSAGSAGAVARSGALRVALRAGVAGTARVTGVLRWPGGTAQLVATREPVEAGERVVLRLPVARTDRRALRRAQGRGRELRAVLRIRIGGATERRVVTLG